MIWEKIISVLSEAAKRVIDKIRQNFDEKPQKAEKNLRPFFCPTKDRIESSSAEQMVWSRKVDSLSRCLNGIWTGDVTVGDHESWNVKKKKKKKLEHIKQSYKILTTASQQRQTLIRSTKSYLAASLKNEKKEGRKRLSQIRIDIEPSFSFFLQVFTATSFRAFLREITV